MQIPFEVIKPGDHVVDATLGAGKDTLQLAKILKGVGKLTCYDIQPKAIERAQKTLSELSDSERKIITFKLASHAPITEQNIALIVYNLGYLPGGDKSITTQSSTTLQSVKSALLALNKNGILSITCYPGHLEGAKEEAILLNFFEGLEKRWNVRYTRSLNRHKAPSHILVTQSEFK